VESGTHHRGNTWYAWLVLNYSLAADIVYRAGFARQAFGQIADLLFIWLGAQLFYVILEMSAGGTTVAALRASAIPATALAIVIAAGALILSSFWGSLVVTVGGALLALMAVLALALVWRRKV